MYEVTFISKSASDKFDKLMKTLEKSNPVKYKSALKAFNSLKVNPRMRKPGDKHQLKGDRRGTWSMWLQKICDLPTR